MAADDARAPRIKVCGVRGPADVAGVVGAGLDAIGLVAHPPSPRAVEPQIAAALVAALPPQVLPVAVLVDSPPAQALAWARRAGARAVQLCGAERPEDWRGFALPVWRRLPVAPEAEAELEAWRGVARLFVLDHPAAPGGTGLGVDLERAGSLARRAACLLAGGLDADNVAARVARVRPAGVDASSRLESAPGLKDPERVRRFVEAARAALETLEIPR